MKLLITNDDGIETEGLKRLVAGLADRGRGLADKGKKLVSEKPGKGKSGEFNSLEVYVVAPEGEYTGYGGAVSFGSLIEVEQYSLNLGESGAWRVKGTPADCVIMGLDKLVGEVDLVISGINDEPNLGDDIRFSGTLGACREAAFSGIPAIGLSVDYNSGDSSENYYSQVVEFVRCLLWGNLGNKGFFNDSDKNNLTVEKLDVQKLPEGVYLNVNFPNCPQEDIRGGRVARLGRQQYRDRVQLIRKQPHSAYRLHGSLLEQEQPRGTDVWAVRQGYISVTPLNRDNTDFRVLELLKKNDK